MNPLEKLIGFLRRDLLELWQGVTDPDATALPAAGSGGDASERDPEFDRLEAELRALHCDEGVRQLVALRRTYAGFRSVLERQLAPQELTFARYTGTAEQVYLAALDNLDAILPALHGLRAIEAQSRPERPDLEAPSERSGASLTQRSHIADRLACNERALAALEQATAELASVRMGRGRAAVDLDSAMNELQRLAQRARRYAGDSDA